MTTHIIRHYVRSLGLVLFPERCIVCAQPLERATAHRLCALCEMGIEYNDTPGCPGCDRPDAQHSCLACPAWPQSFDAARAPLVYNTMLRQLLQAGRHGHRRDVWRALARIVAHDAQARLHANHAQALICVASDAQRLVARSFNPAARLAHQLGRFFHRPVLDVLMCTRHNLRQSTLTASKRGRQMTAGFVCKRAVPHAVILVDDYIMTGATARAAARALRQAGAQHIVVLAVARALA